MGPVEQGPVGVIIRGRPAGVVARLEVAVGDSKTRSRTARMNKMTMQKGSKRCYNLQTLLDDYTGGEFEFMVDFAHEDYGKAMNVIETLKEQMGLNGQELNVHIVQPKNRKEAMAQPEWPEWLKGEEKEISSQHKLRSWAIVELPEGRKAVKSGWVYKLKINDDGSVSKFKCRLVCKGYSQEYGVDYNETFAPCVQRSTLRMMLALATTLGIEVHEHDIETAFLNGEIEEEIYMEQPDGHEVRNKYCKRGGDQQ